jgi:hypothetical protein
MALFLPKKAGHLIRFNVKYQGIFFSG